MICETPFTVGISFENLECKMLRTFKVGVDVLLNFTVVVATFDRRFCFVNFDFIMGEYLN